MTIIWHRYYLIGFLSVIVCLMVGCSPLVEKYVVNSTPPPPPAPVDGSLDEALAAYRWGDYQRALTLFTEISEANVKNRQRQRARMGEICCRLMLADSQENVTIAMELWDRLKASGGDDAWRVERILFEPLADRWSSSVGKPRPDVSESSANREKVKTGLTDLKKKTDQAADLQRRLDKAIKENQALKQKIKALETIDQNIQKKKTQISTPSE